ncbi:MAG: cytochrome c oxidase assembly protein [Candidatus Promineifilaceae bacterium]
MDPILRAVLTSWDWRIEVILVLALAGTIYTRGWLRLRKRTAARQGRNRWQAGAVWRPIVYIIGLLVLGLALMSPIDVLGSQLFFMHMIQHIVLVSIVPPLLLSANPLPFFLWGMPGGIRKQFGRLLGRQGKLRLALQKFAGPGTVWVAYVIIYLGWHDPSFYNAALESELVHDLEHISFFGVAMLYWWLILGVGPVVHKPFSAIGRFIFLLMAIPPNMIAGMAIAFSHSPIYPHYEVMPRIWNISVMSDQRLAGVIMWVPGSMMYIMAALVAAARWLQDEEQKPALPESEWATDEAFIAPGLEKR